jgi:UDP-N-acetylmuramoyl-tripeptide--D-alanyl-D-alanine ligase
VPILGGAADSRLVKPGDLFAAYPGEQTDGNLFVDAALDAGAVFAVCNVPVSRPGATVAVVPDTVAAMAALAHEWRQSCPVRVVGITGTVGKTTAKEFTASVLAAGFRTHRSGGNFNSREGLPLALMSLTADHEVSVLEIAMDSRGEIAELCAIADPEIGAVLNVGLTHVSKLGSIEAIQQEKLSLVRSLPRNGTAILNADDPRVVSEAPLLSCRVITFGQDPAASLRVVRLADRGLEGTDLSLSFAGECRTLRSPLPGAHTVTAVLVGVAAATALGMSFAEAVAAAEAVDFTGRMRLLMSAGGVRIVDDRYNSSPASLAGALGMLGRATGGRRIALLGRMAELGDYEEQEHRRAGAIAARSCDFLAAVGEPCRALVEAAKENGLAEAHWFEDKNEAAEFVANRMAAGDTVLVKASRSQEFETLIPLLEGAG